MRLLALLMGLLVGAPHTNPSQIQYTASGGTSRTLASKLSDSTSVLDYGAVCDGIIDDHAAIQAALNESSAGTITLPCGKTCNLSTTGITIPSFKTLKGCSIQSSGLKCNTNTCVTRDGVQGAPIRDLFISATGSSATLVGLLDTNLSGVSLRNDIENVRIIGDQSPPVAGSIGHFIHSVNANSLYSIRAVNETVGGFDKCVRSLGDDGTASNPPVLGSTGGANDNHWTNPQIDNCVNGFTFEGYASANTVQGLHCNGGGQAFDQLCVQIGDGTNGSVEVGNRIDLYADNSVSGHVGKSFAIMSGALRNEIRSYSGSTQGTNANLAAVDRNLVVELNAVSGRLLVTAGNVQLFSDATTPGIFVFPASGLVVPGLLQNSSSDIVNAILWRIKANIAMTHSGAVLMEWNNTSRVAAVDLNGAIQQTGQTFANLGSPATPPNGTIQYCSDCTIANPCAGAGTGAFAKRLNGVWVCN